MEFSGAQKALLAIPSRWPPILLGIILSLFISAICTSNFAMRVIPTSESSPPASSSPWASSPSSTFSTISSQLFFLLFRRSHTKASTTPHLSNPDMGESATVLPSSMPPWNSSLPSAMDAMHHSNKSESTGSSFDSSLFTNATNNTLSKTATGNNSDPSKLNSTGNNSDSSKLNSTGSKSDPSELSSTGPSALQSEHAEESSGITRSTNDPSSSSLLNVSDPQALLNDKADAAVPVDDEFLRTSQQPASSKVGRCDISVGSWVEDSSYPLYSPSTCPYVDESFNCQQNGRPDSKYDKWRWAPRDCSVPRFNGTHFLEILRGKRLVFVGDSLNRNQWESMLCMLWEPLPDKRRLVQIHGGRISKLPGAYVFKFLDYDFKVEFYTSPYLVDKEDGVNYTDFRVRLDKMDISERRWRKGHVLVFNTGHWWTPDKIGNGENRFQEGLEVHKTMSVSVAYRKALSTWAKWVDTYVNPENTTVFFRGYSPIHYVGGQWNSGGQCQDETNPIFNETFIAPYPAKMQALEEILQQMNVPVQLLNITRLSDFRKDGHPALYGHAQQYEGQYQDCSHWCLPGLPDTWNELLYFALLTNQQGYASP